MIKNLYKAPKSTILALVMLASLTVLKHQHVIENDTYATTIALVIPLAFTDLGKERKTTEQE